jgi:hypothetical protein
MSEFHEGGCLCGAVRYRTTEQPVRTTVCHCTFCQRRTGSAFAVIVYFNEKDVEFTAGNPTRFEHRSDESGRWLRIEFCPRCGTTVAHTAEVFPGVRAIAGGTFDERAWFRIERHAWTRSACPWVVLPEGVQVFPTSSVAAVQKVP